MKRMNIFTTMIVGASLMTGAIGQSVDPQLAQGRKAIESRTGCFLVDYNFVETDALKPGYVRDTRIYDVDKDKSVKEWIFAEDIAPTRIRLQHVLLVTDLSGKLIDDSLLKHTGEDWEYNAPFLYEYSGVHTWNVKALKQTPNLWTRRVTSLDDGLRYQCAAAWNLKTEYADWSCDDAAPIPGRETRDMHRSDYNQLDRSSRILVYNNNWLEREANIKTVDENGNKTQLVKEWGKTWYVRLPDSECSAAQQFVQPRLAFWTIVREAWDQVLTGDSTYIETPTTKDQPSRYERIMKLEEEYRHKDLSNPTVAQQAREAVLKLIESSRGK